MSDSDIQMKLGKIEKDYKKGMEHASRDGGDTVSVQRAKEALDGLADALLKVTIKAASIQSPVKIKASAARIINRGT